MKKIDRDELENFWLPLICFTLFLGIVELMPVIF